MPSTITLICFQYCFSLSAILHIIFYWWYCRLHLFLLQWTPTARQSLSSQLVLLWQLMKTISLAGFPNNFDLLTFWFSHKKIYTVSCISIAVIYLQWYCSGVLCLYNLFSYITFLHSIASASCCFIEVRIVRSGLVVLFRCCWIYNFSMVKNYWNYFTLIAIIKFLPKSSVFSVALSRLRTSLLIRPKMFQLHQLVQLP